MSGRLTPLETWRLLSRFWSSQAAVAERDGDLDGLVVACDEGRRSSEMAAIHERRMAPAVTA